MDNNSTYDMQRRAFDYICEKKYGLVEELEAEFGAKMVRGLGLIGLISQGYNTGSKPTWRASKKALSIKMHQNTSFLYRIKNIFSVLVK